MTSPEFSNLEPTGYDESILPKVYLLFDLKMLTVGELGTTCFVVWREETKEAVVINPGFSTENEGKKRTPHY